MRRFALTDLDTGEIIATMPLRRTRRRVARRSRAKRTQRHLDTVITLAVIVGVLAAIAK